VLDQAEAQSGFRPWKQLPSFDGVGGGAGEDNVAAATIELPSKGVEAAHGPVGLHGVGVLFEPHPGGVERRLLGRKQPDRAADGICGHPGGRLRAFRGMLGGQRPEELEGGPTRDRFPISQGDGKGAEKRRINPVLCVPCVGVIADRTVTPVIPDREAPRSSGRREVL